MILYRNIMKKIIVFILFFLTLTTLTAFAECCNAKLIKIYDGDTIRVSINGQEQSIRLIGIDCYETSKIHRAYKQAYQNNISIEEVVRRGKESKLILTHFLKTHPDITIETHGTDKYGRTLGVVYANGTNVNEYMLYNGGAMKYVYGK